MHGNPKCVGDTCGERAELPLTRGAVHQRRGRVVAELTELLGEVPVVLPPTCRLDPTE